MPYESKVEPLLEAKTPVGCHLQAISSVGGCFRLPTGTKAFDKLLERGHGSGTFAGDYFTGTICSVTRNAKDYDGGPIDKLWQQTDEELRKRGFVVLGIQPGAHGSYEMYLYGKGFTIPKETK